MTLQAGLPINQVMQGDSLQRLKELPDNCIDFGFTSPPYYALRDYQVEGQIGLEGSMQEYLEKLWSIFDEFGRALKPTGTLWVNLGDTFAGSGGAGGDYNDGGLKEGQPKWKQNTYRQLQVDPTAHRRNNRKEQGIRQKCLMMIPERFAIGMIDRGWILRAKIIWFKPNGMIESSKDRPKLDYEFLYMFSKSQKYWFNYIEAKKPLKSVTVKRNQYAIGEMGRLDGTNSAKHGAGKKKFAPPIGGIRAVGNNGNTAYSGNEWEVPHDGMAKIGSVWGLPPESIWSIAPRTFGHEYCETCDILVVSRDLLMHCLDCGFYYKTAELKKKKRGSEQSALEIESNDVDIDEDYDFASCPKCKSRRKEITCPVCKNKVHMHFAMFPEELVTPAIKMACPDQVCSKCGKPRFPIYTPTEEYKKLLGKAWHDHENDEAAGQMQEKDLPTATADYRISGWTDCGCNAGWTTGIGMDVFSGFNTVGAVLMKQGRNFINIELDPRNVKAGMKRVESMRLQARLM